MRRMMLWVGMLGLALAIAACGALGPQVTEDGRIIFFQDDFSDPNSGWDVYFGEDGSAGYADETYTISVTNPAGFLWANANLDEAIDSARIGVRVRNAGESEMAGFGVLCYYNPETVSFYYFEVGLDSYRAIARVENGEIVEFVTADVRDMLNIPANAEAYDLEVICAPGEQVLLVNGIEVARADDTALQPGDIGLFAASLESTDVSFQFDDLLVTEVEPSQVTDEAAE